MPRTLCQRRATAEFAARQAHETLVRTILAYGRIRTDRALRAALDAADEYAQARERSDRLDALARGHTVERERRDREALLAEARRSLDEAAARARRVMAATAEQMRGAQT